MASTSDQWTVGRLLTWTTDYLKRHGSESPRLDAEVLLAHARNCERIELYMAFHEEVAESQRAVFRELIRRRAEGTPVAYLVGRREFYSLAFHVTPAVLIPRPETEFLVIAMLDVASQPPWNERPLRVADVGTGSGILAVCAARHLPTCRVTAVDISPDALGVARRNMEQHGVVDRVSLLESDLLDRVPTDQTFDLIVSNPPYVSEEEYARLPREVRDYEPKQALVAGPTGVEVIARLIDQAAQRLVEGGTLLLEISPMIREAVQAQFQRQAAFTPPRIVNDLAGLPRVVVASRSATR